MAKSNRPRTVPANLARLLILLPLVTHGTACAPPREAEVEGRLGAGPAFTRDDLGRAIDLAAGYLQRNCREDGEFVYRLFLDPKHKDTAKYNILRHAGTIYALGMHHQRTGNSDTWNAMVRAAGYLRTNCLRQPHREDGLLAVWSPEIEITRKDAGRPPLAKLGGAGLALAALTGLAERDPSSVPLEDLQGLGRFLVRMQKDDGSFYCKYFEGDGPDDRWTSLYYPGEAMLGLLRLHDLDPEEKWLNTAAKGMAYLARTRKGQEKVPPDHWALLATRKLLAKCDSLAEPPASREELVAHAVQICERMLGEQDAAAGGAFTKDRRTAPAATRLEGLMAAYDFLPDEYEALRQRIAKGAEAGIAFLLSAQVESGDNRGAIPFVAPPPGVEPTALTGRQSEVRIDYVQHALSAMIQYEALFLGDREK